MRRAPAGDDAALFVTAATLAYYLRTHPLNARKPGAAPEFLLCDPEGRMWFLRWPNGSMRWETTESLEARAIVPPARPLLTAAENIDPALLETLHRARAADVATETS